MEKETQVRRAEGLTLEELEAHGRAELLPDRIEMRRRRRRRGGGASAGGGGSSAG